MDRAEIIDDVTDNDISGGSFGIRQVKGTFAGAYELLQGKLFERAEQIIGQRSGRYPKTFDPEEMSIIAGVMGITKEVSPRVDDEQPRGWHCLHRWS